MIGKKLAGRIKAVLVTAAMAATSLAVPAIAPQETPTAAGSDDYAKLLQYSLYFYDTNMCGTSVGSTSGISWRDNCHTSDEVPGGFHDAGDHAMFGLPQGYAASMLGWSYYEFKDAYDATGQGDHLKTITDYFCKFFRDSTKLSGNSVSSFLYQKGDGNEDHAYWGAPELQGGNRKMFWTSNSASDIAADYAAALAINYLNFGNPDDLKYAEALYNFSTQHNRIESNGTSGFYLTNNASPQDEQANAAGWLYLATKNDKYKSDCASKQTQYLGWCDGWDNRGLGAACVYAHITGDWSKVNSYIGGVANGNGYLCMDAWGSARYNCSMQFTALVASKNSNADFGSWCQGQMNYILGNNPANTCFVTGFASNSAKNAHHRAASGYQGYDGPLGFSTGTKTYHPTNGKTLIGALVGGPADAGGTYSDVIDDYKCNEVALDYNAGLVGAAAGLYSKYKSGSTVNSIVGVDKIYSGSSQPVVTTTTAPPVVTTTTTTTTTSSYNPPVTTTSSSSWNPPVTTAPVVTGGQGENSAKVNQKVDKSNNKTLNIPLSSFVPAGAKVKKIIVNISANGNNSNVNCGGGITLMGGEWQELQASNVSCSGNTAKVEYDVSQYSDSIDTQYGDFQFGYWWGDQNEVTVDSVACVYEAAAVTTTTKITTTTVATTTTTTTTTAYQSVVTTTVSQSDPVQPAPNVRYGDVNLDGDVGLSDVVALSKYLVNSTVFPLSAAQRANGDCNCDGVVDAMDCMMLTEYNLQQITQLG